MPSITNQIPAEASDLPPAELTKDPGAPEAPFLGGFRFQRGANAWLLLCPPNHTYFIASLYLTDQQAVFCYALPADTSIDDATIWLGQAAFELRPEEVAQIRASWNLRVHGGSREAA